MYNDGWNDAALAVNIALGASRRLALDLGNDLRRKARGEGLQDAYLRGVYDACDRLEQEGGHKPLLYKGGAIPVDWVGREGRGTCTT